MKLDHPRHERDAEPGRERRQPGRADGRQADPCRGGRREERAARARRRRTSASPMASLTVKDGVVSGGGKTVTYGALIGDKLFNVTITGFSAAGNATTPAQAVAGAPGTKPVSAVQDRRHEPAAHRHPGQGHRQVHLRRTTSASRACSTAASCGRAARAPTATARRRRSSRSTRARSSTSRARRSCASANFLGVVAPTASTRRSRRAAQLKVKWADTADAPEQSATSSSRCATRTAPARRRPAIALEPRQLRHARSSGARTTLSPDLQVPLHGPRCRSARRAASPT